MVKKEYNIGDTVWIYGINRNNTPIKGEVIHSLEIPNFIDTYYVVSVPTHIEPLLELRTWHNISQDEHGPIGAFRQLSGDMGPTKKFLSKTGVTLESSTEEEEDAPSAEQIHSALEKSIANYVHAPLVLKETKLAKPRRRFTKKIPRNEK